MSEIKYQINGQLADNTVTVSDTEDRILVPVTIGSADEQRIIAEMKAEDSGLREETILHVFELEKRVVKRLLLTGYNVSTGLYNASVSFRGTIQNMEWDTDRNQIVVNFSAGADLREAIKETNVGIVGEKGATMFVGGVQDVATRAINASATAGRAFTLTGKNLKIAGTDSSVGIKLTSSTGTVTQVTQDLWVTNNPSKLTFIIPADLAAGIYTLRLTTQYNGSVLLKTPRSVEKTIYIGTTPATGSSGSSSSDSGSSSSDSSDSSEDPYNPFGG